MILVDTSVWIDHLHRAEPDLVRELDRDEIGCRTLVIQELALSRLRDRRSVPDLLGSLSRFPLLRPAELLSLVESHRLCDDNVVGVPSVDRAMRRRQLGASCPVPPVGCSPVAAPRCSRHAAASVSKPMVAAAVMRLVQDGKLRADNAVDRWLKRELPLAAGVQVWHLLSMTSGLPDYGENPKWKGPGASARRSAPEPVVGPPA